MWGRRYADGDGGGGHGSWFDNDVVMCDVVCLVFGGGVDGWEMEDI